ncbi:MULTISPECIES: glycosyltransferase family 2 protein [unclassified Cyanobium]|uniref:glycosyltransferase family 2 protein n=1 Tax=unclassified Cyanobium TaxID=2627006 RepID=UPI0020CC5CA9|nr:MULTISPECIES: glycosyltransferase family 2 protein [unclassified Cyanobium]
MMQKNESILLEAWIRYHAEMVGKENLFIFDNGSTISSVIQVLKEAESSGVRIFWEYSTVRNFLEKGALIADLIQRLDREEDFDFYFPLDCDEFLACQTESGPSCCRKDIEEALRPYKGSADVLVIQHKYWNHPYRQNFYSIPTSSRKCFFANGACDYLDLGYHKGRSRLGAGQAKTAIIYFEFHYLPYRFHRQYCRQKLSGRLTDFSRRSLRAYEAKQMGGFHNAGHLLEGKYDYVRSFLRSEYQLEIPTILCSFDRLGIDHGSLCEPEPPIPRLLWLFLLRSRQTFMHRIDDIIDALHRAPGELKRLMVRSFKSLIRLLRRLWQPG